MNYLNKMNSIKDEFLKSMDTKLANEALTVLNAQHEA